MPKSTLSLAILLITLAVFTGRIHSRAQGEFSRVDGFVFPGEAARSEKFPLPPSEKLQSTPKPNLNPLAPVEPVNNIAPGSNGSPFEYVEVSESPEGNDYYTDDDPETAQDRFRNPNKRPIRPRPRPHKRPTTRPMNGRTTARTTTTPAMQFTSISPWLQNCIKVCPKTAEYNPICGTDMQVYNNPSDLTCAKICGKRVEKLRDGTCPTTTEAPSTTRRNRAG
ncbi:hypothetical protein QAD02_017686 [Eretmocerus hayati]|uniref:Uncharacterized protein n=1 Tax=Eretmocerus hayati TaxID=131215 RepID=A0ACC2PEA5_9HYME|nr:hypothetical protein QAD02_017686 [Eretmocerus hayati]